MCVFMGFYAMTDMLQLEENLVGIFLALSYGNWVDLKENGPLR